MLRCAKFVYFVTFLLLIAGCAVIPPPALPTVAPTAAEDPGDSLVGTQWQLVSYGLTGTTTPVSVEPAVTLYFHHPEQIISVWFLLQVLLSLPMILSGALDELWNAIVVVEPDMGSPIYEQR
jgi:hypothetical protein